jgi:hypothetical protein
MFSNGDINMDIDMMDESTPLVTQSHSQNEWKGILLNFLLGGFAVAGTSWLGTFLNPLAGAIFWAYPITILPSLFFMRQQGKNNIYLSKFLISTTFGLILLMATTIAMSLFIKQNNNTSNSSLWIAVGKGTGIYFLGAVAFYLIVHYAGLSHFFM